MGAAKIFVTREMPESGLVLLRAECEVEVWPHELPPNREELLGKVAGLDGLLCMLTDPVDATVIGAAERLRVISTMAAGVNNIDLAAATRRGIVVANTPGVLTETTADLAFALLLAVARRLQEGTDQVRSGQWRTWGPCTLLGQDVHHAVLGLVGLGRIGQAMARRAQGFDMTVLYHDPSVLPGQVEGQGLRGCETLEELLAEADFVSLHLPLTPATRHLINRVALEHMKPGAILINTARGQVVDQDALVEALRSGRIAGAGLDVSDPEPLPADHPLVQHPRCLVVPHIGSASVATRNCMATIAASNLLAVLHGEEPLHRVRVSRP